MVRITFVDIEGRSRALDVTEGTTLMQAALAENVAGIEAECSGAMSCGTCAVAVPQEWLAQLAPAVEQETQMLEFSGKAAPNARLSCQITATPALDGLVVEVLG